MQGPRSGPHKGCKRPGLFQTVWVLHWPVSSWIRGVLHLCAPEQASHHSNGCLVPLSDVSCICLFHAGYVVHCTSVHRNGCCVSPSLIHTGCVVSIRRLTRDSSSVNLAAHKRLLQTAARLSPRVLYPRRQRRAPWENPD